MRAHSLQQKGGMVRRTHSLRVLFVAAAVSLPIVSIGAQATTAGASPAPLTIAYITDVTGQAAAENGSSPAAFEARLDLQNAEGGVNGHKLVPLVIDDQTNPSEIATAVQDAVSKGVIGIVSQSVLMFLAAKYPEQAGIPVTGAFTDGPEWGTQPYTNMFASDEGSVDPKYPANTEVDAILKAHGGTVLGAYGYGISPTSTRAAEGDAQAATHLGMKVGVLNTTVPLGGVDFTTDALLAKQHHVNALVPSLDSNSNYALAQALQQAGVKLKAVLFATGYQPDVIHSPAWSALQGDYFVSLYRPWVLPNAGTEQMQAAMEKYAHFTKSDFPSFGQYEAWAGADLMIKGLELAGKNPTHAAVIKDLRGLKSYTANGLLAEPINYSTIFGHDLAHQCSWVMQAQKNGFVPISSQPICGADIPGTSTASSS